MPGLACPIKHRSKLDHYPGAPDPGPSDRESTIHRGVKERAQGAQDPLPERSDGDRGTVPPARATGTANSEATGPAALALPVRARNRGGGLPTVLQAPLSVCSSTMFSLD